MIRPFDALFQTQINNLYLNLTSLNISNGNPLVSDVTRGWGFVGAPW
jgi:hypothetical protein